MLQNYILVAWRTLLKNKLFSAINIFGLSLGLALGMVILIHVMNTLNVDSFHKNGDRIYRIISEIKSSEGGEWTLASSPLPLKEVLVENKGLFENAVRIYPAIDEDASVGNKTIPVHGAFTSSSYFAVFSFKLLQGDPQTALDRPTDVVISAATAAKFFSGDNAVGKMLVLENLGVFNVTGVLEEPPYGTHINFDILLAESGIANLEKERKLPHRSDSWDSFEFAYTYVLLNPSMHELHLKDRLSSVSHDINKDAGTGSLVFRTQQLSSISPSWDDIYNDIGSGTTWGKMLAEIGAGFIIILAACFNYTNLSIARAFSRTKEIALRKVIGAKRHQVLIQYIVEAVMVSFMALFFSQIVLGILIETQIFHDIKLSDFDLPATIYIILFTIAVGILAGILPGSILSSLKPLKMLRNVMSEKIIIGLTPRKTLVVFQFSISLLVLIFMTTFHSQFAYMSDLDPGFKMENILSIPISDNAYPVLTAAFSGEAGVENVAGLSGPFGRYPTGSVSVSNQAEKRQAINVNYFFVDSKVLHVSELALIAGANFPDQLPDNENQIIVNEKTIEVLGFQSPHEALGEVMLLADSIPVTITGVIKNFYSEGVGIPFRPLLLRHAAGRFKTLQVVVTPGQESKVQSTLEKVWKRVIPEKPFTYIWLKRQHDERYSDMGSISILGFLAFMAISIAFLGLLGLVVYSVETKRKEISIRKVIGANTGQIVYLLSKGFMALLLIAGCIAIPISYVASEAFLMNFANRIQVGFMNSVMCFAGVVSVCLLMIFTQTFKASAQNPAINLKSD